MYSKLTVPRNWSRIACLYRLSTSEAPVSRVSSDGIAPPPRVPRGPTDILQALAATVGNDPTAAHYKYHDDPFLTPLSNFRKRSYALSAEAGRKAAAWIRDEHAEWFTTREWDPPSRQRTPYFNADPRIEAYAPKTIYNEETKVSEEDLRYTIKNGLVEDAVKVYQLLGGATSVDNALRLSLLQLLCFYNERESDSAEWLEERWFSANTRERQAVTWKLGGLAEEIFTSLDSKTSEAYCTVIQGMAKYYQAERAYQLSQEAAENGVSLSTGCYNALLGCIGFLKEGTALRSDALLDTLRQMRDQGMSPNLETLSACLRSVSAWGGSRQLRQLALQLVAEMRSVGVEPGLSAYYYLLCIFCKERGPRTDILSSILSDLEKKKDLVASQPTDTFFFITAMGVCSDHMQDMTMAERVHALLMKGDNYMLLGDAFKESIYYRHLVTVACRCAPLDRCTELLDQLVPHVYVPEPTVMDEIVKALDAGGAGERLAQAWSQMLVFGLAKRTRLVERLLDSMCNCYQHQEEEVKERMRAAAADMIKFGQLSEEQQEGREQRTPPPQMSASALSNIVELTSAPGADEAAWEAARVALERLRRGAVGVPARPQALVDAARRAAAEGHRALAATAVTYLAECAFPEAEQASVGVMSVFLNRPEEEVLTMLRSPRNQLLTSLDQAALEVADAYRLSESGGVKEKRQNDTSSDSDSDSDSSDSDTERK